MECNSLKSVQMNATGQCEDYGHFMLVSAYHCHKFATKKLISRIGKEDWVFTRLSGHVSCAYTWWMTDCFPIGKAHWRMVKRVGEWATPLPYAAPVP